MRIVFMGTPEFAAVNLQALLQAGREVVGVFTQPDRPKGRGGKLQQSPVKELALQAGIPVYQPLKIRADGLEDLKALHPDVCVTAAFGQILSQAVLDVPAMGTVNVHASLLPRHRGAAPVQWAVLQGDAVTGVTTMFTDAGIDTGDMLLRAETPITDDEDAGTLLNRLAPMGAELLLRTLDLLEKGECPREKQNPDLATYDPMLKKEMGILTFTETARETVLRVRAMSPWPCAYVPLKNGALKVWKAKAAEGSGVPGTVLRASAKEGLVVAVADGAVELCEIQAPGAKRMAASAYLLGHAVEPGTLLSEVEA